MSPRASSLTKKFVDSDSLYRDSDFGPATEGRNKPRENLASLVSNLTHFHGGDAIPIF